jgi:hypothetical protein
MGVARLLVETDCMGAKAKITGSEMDRLMHGQLVEEIKAMLQGSEDYKVQHVNRKCNEVAHLIAKDSCENKSYNTWVDSVGIWLWALVHSPIQILKFSWPIHA